MDIKIKNFGKIKEADIDLSGLALIAGPNDSGKSTVGKCLFALIKSVANYPQYYNQIKTQQLYQEYFNPLRIDAERRSSNFIRELLGYRITTKDDTILKTNIISLFSDELKEASIDKKIEYLKYILETSKRE